VDGCSRVYYNLGTLNQHIKKKHPGHNDDE
jgi:hypothetical protein